MDRYIGKINLIDMTFMDWMYDREKEMRDVFRLTFGEGAGSFYTDRQTVMAIGDEKRVSLTPDGWVADKKHHQGVKPVPFNRLAVHRINQLYSMWEYDVTLAKQPY